MIGELKEMFEGQVSFTNLQKKTISFFYQN